MHEYPAAKNIIDIVSGYTIKKVKKINLVIGESSGILGESLSLYFDIIAEGTPCGGAALSIKSVKPALRCKTCGAFFLRKPFTFDCECGGEGMPTEIGNEFYIESIEVMVDGH